MDLADGDLAICERGLDCLNVVATMLCTGLRKLCQNRWVRKTGHRSEFGSYSVSFQASQI
jgi:hypothetical protein